VSPRIVLAKPGLDGHDRGIKVIAMALRDAGAEVIYLGLRRTVAEIVTAAVEDDADVIGISVLSGAHLALADDLLRALAAALREAGVAAVYPVGTGLHEVVDGVLALADRAKARP
jgi:methylmalonyl-CoA mutase C-terminal domain/subunit